MCISPTQNELEQKNNSNNTDNDDDNSSSNDTINNKINTITTRTNTAADKICIRLREEHWLGVAQCPPKIFDGLVAPASARNLECNVAVVTTMA